MNMCVNGLIIMSLLNFIIYIIILFLKKKRRSKEYVCLGKVFYYRDKDNFFNVMLVM